MKFSYFFAFFLAISVNLISSQNTISNCTPMIQGLPTPCGIINQINSARTNPGSWISLILGNTTLSSLGNANDIQNVTQYLSAVLPVPPLTLNDTVTKAAQLQADYLIRGWGDCPHYGCSNSLPWDRVALYGNWSGVGENIAGGMSDPVQIVAAWLIDSGVPDRGHRLNLMSAKYTVAGVGISDNSDDEYDPTVVVDFVKGLKPKSVSPPAPPFNVSINCGTYFY